MSIALWAFYLAETFLNATQTPLPKGLRLSVRCLVAAVTAVVVTGAFGQSGDLKAPVIPSPPQHLAMPATNPAGFANLLSDAVSSPESVKRLAAWIAAYDAAGLTVWDQEGNALSPSGTSSFGPRYWQVWYASSLGRRGQTVSFTDAARLLSILTPNERDGALAESLMSDLISLQKTASTPQQVFFAAFVMDRIRRTSPGWNPASANPLEGARIDLASVQLIAWTLVRGMVYYGAAAGKFSQASPTHKSRLAGLFSPEALISTAHAQSSPSTGINVPNRLPCGGFDDFLTSSIGGGINIPLFGIKTDSTLKRVMNWVGSEDPTIRAAEQARSIVNIALAALLLAMRINEMEVAAIQTPDPLRRTKDTSDGKEGEIVWALSAYRKNADGSEADEQGTEAQACLARYLYNLAGIRVKVPPTGRIPNVSLNFEPGLNIPKRVLFAKYDYNGRSTDANGELLLKLIGAAQPHKLSDRAKPVMREFSVIVSAQVAPIDLAHMLKVFQAGSGVSIGGVNLQGENRGLTDPQVSTSGKATLNFITKALSAALVILETIHYDLGEFTFNVQDWDTHGWSVSGQTGAVTYVGIICDVEVPFTVVGRVPGHNDALYRFVPSSPISGQMTLKYPAPEVRAYSSWEGSYVIDGIESERPILKYSSQGVVEGIVGAMQHRVDSSIELTRLETDEDCK